MGNGTLKSSQLVSIDTVYLAEPAASAWLAMRTACKAATGVQLRIASPYGGYRSLVAQRYMYNHQDQYGVGIAAPGASTHGYGLAADCTTDTFRRAREWLLENCSRYGFAVPPAKDPNHFAHNGTTTAGGIIVALKDVWTKVFVSRGGKNVAVLQELADTKTNTIEILSRLNALEQQGMTDAQIDTISARLVAALPTKITGVLTK